MKLERSSGLLCHITSLPGKFGIGTMGKEAYDFVDFMILSGQKIWQLLPLGHTGYGDSPYQCFSAFAGNPILISLEKLYEEGFLSKKDLEFSEAFDQHNVDYGRVIIYKTPLLKRAYENFATKATKVERVKYANFCKENDLWLEDYAMYIALKELFGGKPWYEWNYDIKMRQEHAMYHYREMLRGQIEFYKVTQYFFFKQWFELKTYANLNNIQIMGDIPLYIAYDSVDAWSSSEYFLFTDQKVPESVAGVPPDYFSATGQLWGNPLYDWEKLKETDFKWWIDRIQANFKIYDILRIDHFRGLAAYWAVPYGETTAINGKWVKAAGKELFEAVFAKLGDLPIVAEDLGVITPDVEELRDSNNMPGMKILQFAFDSGDDNNFLPHTYINNCVVYTGTHDNDTCMGWIRACKEEDKGFVRDYIHNLNEADFSWTLIRMAWASVACWAITPMQDLLSRGSEARMNFPGKASGNWRWRYLQSDLSDELAASLAKLTKIYAR